ncbi:pyridoxamine 5'-phosphate oxidase family protein [Albimonas sp. CAU 1670]|uniref:pyridoxamine 5'-phosphate oxidase family protein n=1 Tax=Albimonas sp. CAU 1670 TaxID=3032599 RepID=UPI0023DA80BA|nr:pyridoxamine 5'-phosphate oxidase family protein [Albimonas sp. CAU 1670]MDF2234651.1 pyridoxamine 5'-phosphate oxidase family protein [Albimonas sp. CAU 1670]
MAKQYDRIEPPLARFISRQKIFFTATATADSRVNLSPRSTDALRVLDENRVCYLDLTGSGSETSAHLLVDGRMTIMFCAFEGPPMILRLYGRGRSLFHGTPEYAERLAASYDGEAPLGARQIVELTADLVQSSCGYAVPLFDHQGERDVLTRWAEGKGAEGLVEYRAEKNVVSIDGLPTGVPA